MILGAAIRRAPGGFLWLFAHELRIAWRSLGQRALRKVWPILLIAVLPTGLGILAAVGLASLPHHAPDAITLNIASIVLAGLGLIMLPPAVAGVLRTFHDRADLELLLSSPVPAGRVLAAKAVGLYASVAFPFLFLFGPFLLTSAVLGRPGMLGGLAMILVLATVATALAFLAARALYSVIGPRGARPVLQVGAALLGGIVFLGFQAQNIAPETSRRIAHALLHAPAPPTPLDWPARAALGAPGPIAGMLVLAAVGAWGATRVAARAIAEPATDRPRARRLTEGTPRFATGLTRIMVMKELRLLARDPELLAQVTLRLVFLIPVVALVFRGGATGFDAPRLAAAATALAGFLASSLGWLTVCAEDAPELLAAAPVPHARMQRAKWLAACAPPVALAMIPAAFAAAIDPWAGLVGAAMAAVTSASAAALQGWYGKPAPRKAFRQRQRAGLVLGIAELIMVGAFSGTALLIARLSPLALLPALVAGGIIYAANVGREEAAMKRARGPVLAIS